MIGRSSGIREWEQRNTLVYRGSSMYPTFRDLDVLSYRNDRPPRAGDVIVFSSSEHGIFIVHRIMRCAHRGYVTQGDNGAPDDEPVALAQVIGRITAANRNGSSFIVRGGPSGLAYAKGCHAFRRLRLMIAWMARPDLRRRDSTSLGLPRRRKRP